MEDIGLDIHKDKIRFGKDHIIMDLLITNRADTGTIICRIIRTKILEPCRIIIVPNVCID